MRLESPEENASMPPTFEWFESIGKFDTCDPDEQVKNHDRPDTPELHRECREKESKRSDSDSEEQPCREEQDSGAQSSKCCEQQLSAYVGESNGSNGEDTPPNLTDGDSPRESETLRKKRIRQLESFVSLIPQEKNALFRQLDDTSTKEFIAEELARRKAEKL